MQRLPHNNSWYGFSTLDGEWGAINFAGWIDTSRGRVELPIFDGFKDTPLFLVGATYLGNFFMAGQSQNGNGTILYISGAGWFRMGLSYGVSPCAFSQDGRYFYFVTSALMGAYRDNHTGVVTPFETPFFVDGIRAVIPPANKIILANTTIYSPTYDLHQYIDFENGLAVGQGANGLVVWYNGIRYLVEPGGTFFIRAMFDGTNLALATVKETERQLVNWFLNVDELVKFPVADEEVIPRIDKACWLTWFEFNHQAPASTTPLNAQLKVAEGGPIISYKGAKFAQWVQGDSVEDIENQIVSIDSPVVVYWDGRTWPRFPNNLEPYDWLALQAYCFVDESASQFEANMRAVIDSVPESITKIALVCQCYTSNDSLTKNIKSLVPVFARLARDYHKIDHLLVFSDQGRPTGLNDHPELIKPWTDLYQGIEGTPGGDNLEVMPTDVWAVITQMHERFSQKCIDEHPGDNESASRAWTKMTNEQVLFSFPNQGWCWKSGDPNRPPSKDSIARLLTPFTGYDMLSASGANGPKFLAPYPPQANDLTGQHPILDLVPTNWLGEVPADIGLLVFDYTNPARRSIGLLVFDYTNPARRSDPLGCLVKFEAASSKPVDEISFRLNDGDLPFVWRHTEGKDGRYYRAIAFKVTVPGEFTLTITARNNQGAEVSKSMPLTVIN